MITQQSTIPVPRAGGYQHEADHGFCVVCGSVWPCSRATPRQSTYAGPPVARPDTIAAI